VGNSSAGDDRALFPCRLGLTRFVPAPHWLGPRQAKGARSPLRTPGTGGYEHETVKEEEIASARLEIELSDVNDIISALKEISFKQYIILEDFHYLPVETQKDFAFALKSYHENSDYTFIIVGVWREENRLVYYNEDLTGRVISINADKWTPEELREVVTAGGKLLNITFDAQFESELIDGSSDAVHLVQETCRKACQAEDIYRTAIDAKVIGVGVDAGPLLNEVVDQQSGRYRAFITNFSEGVQVTGLEMYKWILFAVINKDVSELEDGIRRSEINDTLKANHPEGETLNPGNLSQALLSIASLQVQKNIRPIILDYDQTLRVLNIVDKSFITWLSYQDQSEVLAELDITL